MKRNFKKSLLIVCLVLLAASQKISAQTFSVPQVFTLWDSLVVHHSQILKKKGFTEVYGGPKKAGGELYLYRNKTAGEYLFIHYTESGKTSNISYYIPTKTTYLKMKADQGKIKPAENVYFSGVTRYNDGKKYYQVNFKKL